MARIILLGAGGLSRQAIWLCHRSGHDVVAMIDETNPEPAELDGIPVSPSLAQLPVELALGDCHFLSAVGSAALRSRWAREYAMHGKGFISVVDPSAEIAPTASIGVGTLVQIGAIVSTNVSIGKHVIIGFNSSVSHDASVGDCSHLAGGVALAGGTRIGMRCLVGVGAVVLPGVTVGDDAVVGAGSVVVHNVPAETTVVGAPAR